MKGKKTSPEDVGKGEDGHCWITLVKGEGKRTLLDDFGKGEEDEPCWITLVKERKTNLTGSR